CWAMREANGAGEYGCVPKRWVGPALLVHYSDLSSPRFEPDFISGQIRAGIVTVVVRLHGGHVLRLRVIDGLILTALPRGFVFTGKGDSAVGYDAQGHVVARVTLPT